MPFVFNEKEISFAPHGLAASWDDTGILPGNYDQIPVRSYKMGLHSPDIVSNESESGVRGEATSTQTVGFNPNEAATMQCRLLHDSPRILTLFALALGYYSGTSGTGYKTHEIQAEGIFNETDILDRLITMCAQTPTTSGHELEVMPAAVVKSVAISLDKLFIADFGFASRVVSIASSGWKAAYAPTVWKENSDAFTNVNTKVYVNLFSAGAPGAGDEIKVTNLAPKFDRTYTFSEKESGDEYSTVPENTASMFTVDVNLKKGTDVSQALRSAHLNQTEYKMKIVMTGPAIPGSSPSKTYQLIAWYPCVTIMSWDKDDSGQTPHTISFKSKKTSTTPTGFPSSRITYQFTNTCAVLTGLPGIPT
jgi:hypothetical protein